MKAPAGSAEGELARTRWTGSRLWAAARQAVRAPFSRLRSLPDVPAPPPASTPAGGIAAPGYAARVPQTGLPTCVAERDRRLAQTDLLRLRPHSTRDLIRQLTYASPDVSASVHAYTRMCITPGYRAVARRQDGTPDETATKAVQVLLTRFDQLAGTVGGWSGLPTLHALGESLVKELRIDGACALELVLDPARLPARLQPVPVSQIRFVDDGKTRALHPVQWVAGQQIDLDYPAFFYEALDQDLLDPYAASPMESALQPTLRDAEFSNDVRRVIKRALHPRLAVAVQNDLLLKSAPPDVLADQAKLDAYRDKIIDDLERSINALEPDDALVAYDTLTFSYLNNGNSSLSREYETLQTITDAKVASGVKAPGTVLGHASGSQNIASTESMLFVKYCDGVQARVNSIFSRALTLAARLLGHDVYIEFAFDRIDLRPQSELEAFAAMRQSRVLEQLSLGLLTDEEAAIELTGRLPPPGSPRLSGTFFRQAHAQAQPDANPYSGTSALGHALKPDTPQQPKGSAAAATPALRVIGGSS